MKFYQNNLIYLSWWNANNKYSAMKYLLLILLSFYSLQVVSQSNARIKYENKLSQLVNELREKTNAEFNQGPLFIFDEPYKAIFKKDSEFIKGTYPNTTTIKFIEGDTVLVIGAPPVGRILSFRSLNSDEVIQTKAFGSPGFEIINADAFKAQVRSIKDSDWQAAESLASLLSCGTLESVHKSNFEKHHLNIGDTPVFFQVRLEEVEVRLYVDLQTYGGSDFKDVGVAKKDETTLVLNFDDGIDAKLSCIQDDDRFAIFDITNYKSQFLSGITRVTFTFSKKEVSQELFNADKYAIGLKMECIKKANRANMRIDDHE